MLKLWLKAIGIEVRPCRNPWADNRQLQDMLAAERFNKADAERRLVDMRSQLLVATSRMNALGVKYCDARDRIIELEDEVNQCHTKMGIYRAQRKYKGSNG